ncbi:MAG TPA: tetratricopeptide repeat protein [Isosphaeraceae bacterium]|nr:tetratricopeptide repeat protein [Isosphaeraceae bacterium]
MNLRPRIGQVVLVMLVAGAAGLARTAAAVGQSEPRQPSPIPPWKRLLSDEAAAQVAKLEEQIAQPRREGRFVEAIAPAREAAEIRTRLQGADHWQAADARRAVDDLRKIATLPEEGRKAMASVGELAQRAEAEYHQGHYAESERVHRILLEIRRKWLGEDHPETAASYNDVALNLNGQGMYAQAEPLCRKAPAIRLKVLGENHPTTASSYNNLAANLDGQGKLGEAVASWTAAAAIYERIRSTQSASGLERSVAADRSSLPALAVALARQGQPRAAWVRWEAGLARGLLDELSARQLRPLTPDELRREGELDGQLQRLDERINRLVAEAKRTQEEDKQLDALRQQQSTLRGQWVEFQNALDREYQAFAGKPANLGEVQKALPSEAALVGWLDVAQHHWACIVHHQGDPTWVAIPGSGPDGAWTTEDDGRPGKLRDALAGHQLTWGAPAEALAHQRLAPLRPT